MRSQCRPKYICRPVHEETGCGWFCAQEFGAIFEFGVIDDERASLAAREVFGFMKAVTAQMADRAEPTFLVFGEYSLRRILDDQQIMPPGDRHDLVHFASDAGVMDGKNSSGAGSDRRFDEALVDVERIRPDVDKDGRCAPEHDGVGGGDEGVGRKDHLVAGTKSA